MKPFVYQITVVWSTQDEAYEARVPVIKGCLAYGNSPEKAVKEVQVAAAAMLQVLAEVGKAIPAPDLPLARLAGCAPVLNLSAIARKAGISAQTLMTKLRRGTALAEDEAAAVGRVLQDHGLRI
jgi:predicted RNase H-like HicB family nuclease